VDRKLIELAQRLNAKIVTNDFNLNKVASVQGITVLNINLLANAVRPRCCRRRHAGFVLREARKSIRAWLSETAPWWWSMVRAV